MALVFGLPTVVSAQLQLTFPVSRIVFQRTNANQADVPFRARLTSSAVTSVKVRLVVRQGGSATGWSTFTPVNGTVEGLVPGVMGGWYDLEAEAFSGEVSLGTSRIQRVGVGEVLLATGQSNAQGFPYATGAVDDRVSCVNYYDGNITEYRFPLSFSQLSGPIKVGPTNELYFYGLLGDKLVQRWGVPVLIYGAALGSTSSIQWRQTAEGRLDIPDAEQWGGADDLRPYRAIKATLNHYVRRTGLRAILWHQGESDKGKSGSAYAGNLQKVIEVSRQDTGAPALPWVIARASWFEGSGDNNIVSAQNQVIAQVTNCYPGPNTDTYGNSYRQDGTHFLQSFYPQLADLWSQSLSDNFLQQSTPYVLTQTPPRLTAGLPQPAYQYSGGHLVIPFLDEAMPGNDPGGNYKAQLMTMSGQFITNLGVGNTRPMRVMLPDNLSGSYQVRIAATSDGTTSPNSTSITVFTPPYGKGTGTGLFGQYISGSDPNNPVLHTELDGPLDFTWFDVPPSAVMPPRDYIIRWTGQIEAPVTGTYTIKTNNDDGARVWINNQLIIDDWANYPYPQTKRGQISLQANQKYDIRVDLLQGWFNAQARLLWVVPGSNQAIYMPKDRLYPASGTFSEADPMQVVFPTARMVFQRNNANSAQIRIAGTCPTRTERVEVRVSPTASGYGQDNDFYVTLDSQPANGYFSGSLTVATGWYKLDVQSIVQNKVICHTRVTPVGVGEVFIVAGEGNAQGVTPIRSVAAADDDRVSSVPHYNFTDTTRLPLPPIFNSVTADGTIGPRGSTAWCWGELGDLLVKRLNLPVLFYNVAWAGTTVRNWRESAGQGTTTPLNGTILPVGMPYGNLKRVLADYVPLTGLRAILWQQGESEFYSSDQQATQYAADLQALISRSRTDAGAAQLPWLVARSSADNTTVATSSSGSYEPVTNAQNSVIQTVSQVLAGPITDTVQTPRPGGMYLQGNGLSRLAAAWNQALSNAVWSTTAMLPQPPVLSDLRLSAQVNSRVKPVGNIVEFTITVWNEGPFTATNVGVRCSLPPNVQFVGSESMTNQQGDLRASIASLPAGARALLTFTAQALQAGSYQLAAEIIRADQLDRDSRPNTSIGNGEDDVAWVDFRTSDASSALFTASVSPNAPFLPAPISTQPFADPNRADLTLSLLANRLSAAPNSPVSLSLVVRNTGGQDAQNVQLGCSLPAGLSFGGSPSMSLIDNTVRGTLGSVPAGGQDQLTFTLTPTTTGAWTLQAQIEAATPSDPDSTPNNGFSNGEDDTATVSIRTR
ncbi:hypothetical protein GCM10028773_32990 [Spirosoma koreense]